MTEKEIRSEIIEKIKHGTSKSDLHDQYKDVINDKTLRGILASRPSYKLLQKYKKVHLYLSIIWGLFILLELSGIFDLMVDFDVKFFISLILSIYITLNIWNFNGRFFLPGIIWFGFSIMRLFTELDSFYQYDSDYAMVLIILIVYSIILGVGIYLMYYIRKNVFSYINWFQPILNQEGKIQFEE